MAGDLQSVIAEMLHNADLAEAVEREDEDLVVKALARAEKNACQRWATTLAAIHTVPSQGVAVWCAHCDNTVAVCPSCLKQEWRLGDVPPGAALPTSGTDITQDFQDGYRKGVADCAGSLARMDALVEDNARLRNALQACGEQGAEALARLGGGQ